MKELAKSKGFNRNYPKGKHPYDIYLWLCKLQKWLRDEKGLIVWVEPIWLFAANKDGYRFTWMMMDELTITEDQTLLGYLTFEQALEEGLKCALKSW